MRIILINMLVSKPIRAAGFWASKHLVDQVVHGSLREDIEGVAAIHLFRHFLELVLKDIVLAGRHLTETGDCRMRKWKK